MAKPALKAGNIENLIHIRLVGHHLNESFRTAIGYATFEVLS